MDLELEPKGVQSTISIKARGEVVVQFGNMRHAPFDAEATRNELRLALNEIEGVDIPAGKLSFWPRFPLSVLEEPGNLACLVGVLDRIATETRTASVGSDGTLATMTLDRVVDAREPTASV